MLNLSLTIFHISYANYANLYIFYSLMQTTDVHVDKYGSDYVILEITFSKFMGKE